MGETYSERLRWCLDQVDIPRSVLAKATGLSTVGVQSIARGARGKEPAADTSRKLAAALEVPWEWLALGSGETPSPEALAARGDELWAIHRPGEERRHKLSEPDEPSGETEVDRSEEYAQPDAEVA